MITTAPYTRVLGYAEWSKIARDHTESAESYTSKSRARRDRGEEHPIEDFLFRYYPYPLSLIEQWHPGLGCALLF